MDIIINWLATLTTYKEWDIFLNWLTTNIQWFFSGLGVLLFTQLFAIIFNSLKNKKVSRNIRITGEKIDEKVSVKENEDLSSAIINAIKNKNTIP